jgi:hypothetical protein
LHHPGANHSHDTPRQNDFHQTHFYGATLHSFALQTSLLCCKLGISNDKQQRQRSRTLVTGRSCIVHYSCRVRDRTVRLFIGTGSSLGTNQPTITRTTSDYARRPCTPQGWIVLKLVAALVRIQISISSISWPLHQ